MAHKITLRAGWCNDDTADLDVWCTCDERHPIATFNSRDDADPSLDQLNELAAKHLKEK